MGQEPGGDNGQQDEGLQDSRAWRPRRMLPTDIAGAVFAAAGVLKLLMAVDVMFRNDDPTGIFLTITGLVLLGCGIGMSVTGHRRERQRMQEIEEARRRGFAGRVLMPVGDQIATVISRSTLVLILSGIAATAIYNIIRLNAVAWLPGGSPMLIAGLWLAVLGATAGAAWWTWRSLWEKNRRLAEPHCPECGYVLYGVEARNGWGSCPDCGRRFALTELNVNLVRLDEAGRLQSKE